MKTSPKVNTLFHQIKPQCQECLTSCRVVAFLWTLSSKSSKAFAKTIDFPAQTDDKTLLIIITNGIFYLCH